MSITARALGASFILAILAACSPRAEEDVVYVEPDPVVHDDVEYRKY